MKVIGVGGYARSGKDAFVSIASGILQKNGQTPRRIGFADNLKSEVNEMLTKHHFELDIFTTDAEVKTKLRPLLVWWGCARRDLSDGGLYWVEQVHKQLVEIQAAYKTRGVSDENFVALISDVRFVNEAKWLQKDWGGSFIHLRRFSYKKTRDGYGESVDTKSFDAAPNDEEAKNDPLIRDLADVHVEWESRGISPGHSVTEDNYLQDKVWTALNTTKYFKHQTIGILSK